MAWYEPQAATRAWCEHGIFGLKNNWTLIVLILAFNHHVIKLDIYACDTKYVGMVVERRLHVQKRRWRDKNVAHSPQ
jgi:hypothetical protein